MGVFFMYTFSTCQNGHLWHLIRDLKYVKVPHPYWGNFIQEALHSEIVVFALMLLTKTNKLAHSATVMDSWVIFPLHWFIQCNYGRHCTDSRFSLTGLLGQNNQPQDLVQFTWEERPCSNYQVTKLVQRLLSIKELHGLQLSSMLYGHLWKGNE